MLQAAHVICSTDQLTPTSDPELELARPAAQPVVPDQSPRSGQPERPRVSAADPERPRVSAAVPEHARLPVCDAGNRSPGAVPVAVSAVRRRIGWFEAAANVC